MSRLLSLTLSRIFRAVLPPPKYSLKYKGVAKYHTGRAIVLCRMIGAHVAVFRTFPPDYSGYRCFCGCMFAQRYRRTINFWRGRNPVRRLADHPQPPSVGP